MKFLTPVLSLFSLVAAQGLQQVSNFGANPSNAKMFLYVPTSVTENPAIVVAIHYCSGTANAYFSGSPYRQLADQKGFIVIYPESPYSGTCWDVSSRETLTHEGGANSNSIANMVKHVITEYKADATKVYVTGTSSGAMMTNVLAATYPDVFAAGIVYAGVPAGCFFTNSVNGWNNSCSGGQLNSTPERWAQWVFEAYPDYEGERPRMQIYHGSADTTLSSNNYAETIKQWCGVFGCDPAAPDVEAANSPQQGYTKKTYADGQLVGVWAQGVGHNFPIRGADDMEFFGL